MLCPFFIFRKKRYLCPQKNNEGNEYRQSRYNQCRKFKIA